MTPLGLTHAAVWATACSYLSQAAPPNLRISCQGILQGFHFGFGRGCGALFGGFFASYFGTDITFRVYGCICLIFMGGFIYLHQRYHHDDDGQQPNGMQQNLSPNDPHALIGHSPLLAPHGAPTNPKWQTKFSSGNDRRREPSIDSSSRHYFRSHGWYQAGSIVLINRIDCKAGKHSLKPRRRINISFSHLSYRSHSSRVVQRHETTSTRLNTATERH